MWKNLTPRELQLLAEHLHHGNMAVERFYGIGHPLDSELWTLWQEIRMMTL